MPYYNIKDFLEACEKNKKNVFPEYSVLKDASRYFILKTTDQLLDFIANNGLEKLTFFNTKEWDKNPDKANPIFVDAYEFRSRGKLGYIAFMHNPKTKKWVIKSFHPSQNSNQAIQIAYEKARLLKSEKKNE